MKQPITISVCIILIAILLLMSCDPGHSGNSYVRNESSYSLKLKYKTYQKNDTIIIIPPYTVLNILHFGGLGSGQDFDCCPCELPEISLSVSDSSKTIVKNIDEHKNWVLANPNHRRFENEEIICDFVIEDTDIQ